MGHSNVRNVRTTQDCYIFDGVTDQTTIETMERALGHNSNPPSEPQDISSEKCPVRRIPNDCKIHVVKDEGDGTGKCYA